MLSVLQKIRVISLPTIAGASTIICAKCLRPLLILNLICNRCSNLSQRKLEVRLHASRRSGWCRLRPSQGWGPKGERGHQQEPADPERVFSLIVQRVVAAPTVSRLQAHAAAPGLARAKQGEQAAQQGGQRVCHGGECEPGQRVVDENDQFAQVWSDHVAREGSWRGRWPWGGIRAEESRI